MFQVRAVCKGRLLNELDALRYFYFLETGPSEETSRQF